MRYFVLSLWLFMLQFVVAQEDYKITGKVTSIVNQKEPINAALSINGKPIESPISTLGNFNIFLNIKGSFILEVSAYNFITKKLELIGNREDIDLGAIYLEPDIVIEKTNNLIALTDADLEDDQGESITSGLLQATKDIFLNRAAFDFGQAFFRVRGYDSRNGRVLINGIPMNKLIDGRPQWNNWGGLNDVTRNQEFSAGLKPSSSSFGGVLGTTNIDTRPSQLRPGYRFSSSVSNRTYAGRLMATYTSKTNKKGIKYSISGSLRGAKNGYVEGTLYNAYAIYGAVEYNLNAKHTLLLTGFLASNRRGRSSAITEEVFELKGNTYNPYWGNQNGKTRNSRERKLQEPVFMFNHRFNTQKVNINTGVAYQYGTRSKSRLGYYNAPNPDKTYYRYLPSFYLNSSIGANFYSANKAEEDFLDNAQIDWENIYVANTNTISSPASYILYNDVVKDHQFIINSIVNVNLGTDLKLDIGGYYQNLHSGNYAKIVDLLGANYHDDVDAFSNTKNNVNEKQEKVVGDIFNYNYNILVNNYNVFGQLKYESKKWEGFISGKYSASNYQREGLYKNERFLDSSLGKSEMLSFSNIATKAGATYKINGRNWVSTNVALINRPPTIQNLFINPRENNTIVGESTKETITSVDVSYFASFPKLTGRVTGFHTRFQNTTDINFFFVNAGVGSDFVQEVLTGLDKLHFGAELGVTYQLSSAVKLSGVFSLAKYVYASNPNVSINFDTADASEELINTTGNVNLGEAYIKGYKLAQGPQKAWAIGIDYRDPKYWWVGLSANFLGNNYNNISTITRTNSFYLDPETGENFLDATEENVTALLAQKPLDNFYLLNAVAGKSWLVNGKYVSVFMSLNNLFNTKYRTGGYEQSRNGNYGQLKDDNLSGSPSFAPKYWYGYGRTYFLNFAYSFN
ncbi:TonB-dependent receptor [uncultured Maribacter sp.]|uniref:TonB-dependent receptor n=1 Tax=uncultured Maribacter sp. TaxID=431308 RepID=UPI002630D0B2|nr:TonB-dependent receptor [uncultured Maribacter sp.]